MLTRLVDEHRGPMFVGLPTEWDGSVQVFLHGWDLKRYKGHWYVERVVEEFPIEDAWRMSSSPSVLLVPATRKGRGDTVKWRTLDDLLLVMPEMTLKNADVHVIAHSGGYYNTLNWLDDERVKHVSLLDALYGGINDFREWFNRSKEHRLDLACSHGSKTHTNCSKLVKTLGQYNTINIFDRLNPACRVNYIPVKVSHMSWVIDEDLLSKFFAR